MTLVSIIVPAFCEGERLKALFDHLAKAEGVELIAALAEGDHKTVPPAISNAAKVVRADRGRAAQMNAAAQTAAGEILLFLHADTHIDPRSLDAVRAAMVDEEVSLGAYRLAVEEGGWGLRLFVGVANLRASMLSLPYGDQALFIRRSLFDEVGGYPDWPILEDVALVDKAKRKGKIGVIPYAAATSARRWAARGLFRVTLINWAIMIAFRLGVSPDRLAGWYGARG